MRGEYWIDNSGSAQFADGDIGDANHAVIVIAALAGEMLGHIGLNIDDHGTLDQHIDDIRREIHDITTFASDKDEAAFAEAWDDDPANALYNWMKAAGIDKKYPDKDQFDAAFFLAYGSGTRMDPRDYALKYWGWVRVQGMHVQVAVLNQDSMRTIARGLGDIMDQEGIREDKEEEEDEPTFNIEVMNTREYYTDVPLSVIEECNPGALRVY
jgi:hypothetical protein